MASIEGRETDVVITPAGNRLIVHFFTGILEHFPEIESFQVVQKDPQSFSVRIVQAKPFDNATSNRIRKSLQEKGADGLRIDIDLVDEIPLAYGKRRFVINEINQKHKYIP